MPTVRSPATGSAPLREGCVEDCPGCPHRRLGAAESLARKRAFLTEALAPWASRVAPAVAAPDEERWGYREKVRLHADWSGDSGWSFGLLRRDRLVPIPDCPVHAAPVRQVARLLARTLPPGATFPVVYVLAAGAQLTLVIKSRAWPEVDWPDEGVGRELARLGIEGLWLHLHASAGRRVFIAREWRLARGVPRSRSAQGLTYGPTTFQQALATLHERALAEAHEFLAPAAGDAVVDLYCGVGATLARWTSAGADALGIELSGEAVACARQNAPAADVLQGRCAERLPQLRAWARERAGAPLAYVNPPRTGLEPGVADWLAGELRPERLAYLSCSPGTLRRDLARLQPLLATVRLVPYDFLPQTRHVECLALLQQPTRAAGPSSARTPDTRA